MVYRVIAQVQLRSIFDQNKMSDDPPTVIWSTVTPQHLKDDRPVVEGFKMNGFLGSNGGRGGGSNPFKSKINDIPEASQSWFTYLANTFRITLNYDTNYTTFQPKTLHAALVLSV